MLKNKLICYSIANNRNMKKWRIIDKTKSKNIIKILLENREIKTRKKREEFLNPQLKKVTAESVGINKTQLKKALERIKKAIDKQESIVIYGDYDADGVCASAILWETLHELGAKVMPYIPHRIDEGYGLSIKGIENCKSEIKNCSLIITVDNGIVANEAVDYANKQGIDVIITDHHVLPKKLPKAYAVIHTTRLCGAGIAYLLAQEIQQKCHPEEAERPKDLLKFRKQDEILRFTQNDNGKNHLELVALATIADMVPLVGANRTLTKYGLEALKKTKRIGLLELLREAGLNQNSIGAYEIGHIIAPRLNAMGRLEYAMDSLRLLCTKNRERAIKLARLLGQTNRERQNLTQETTIDAKTIISSLNIQKKKKLIFISHESYQQGVIGLVAGKLVEEFYRPAIVVAKGEKYSKASARSVSGFNIIEFIRSASEFLIDAGGHPMAAGFTVETNKLTILQKRLEDLAEKQLNEEKLTRLLKIDCEIPFNLINDKFYIEIQKFAPFGIGNPEPTFVSRNVVIQNMRLVGSGKHIKFKLKSEIFNSSFEAIAFGMGERAEELHIGNLADIVYTINEDDWLARQSFNKDGNGNKKLQLKIKDLKKS